MRSSTGRRSPALAALLLVLLPLGAATAHDEAEGHPVRLVSQTALTPDGRLLVFAWRGDLWTARADGGPALRLTSHPGRDGQPRVAPSGELVAFVSNRSGSDQVWVMPLGGGTPRRATQHTEGFQLLDWYADESAVLVRARLDHTWRWDRRFFRRSLDEDGGLELLFDAAGRDARLSPDGRRLAFTREGTSEWRKGYAGSQTSQLWLYDVEAESFRKLTTGEHSERSPLWSADGNRLYFTSQESGTFNLVELDLATGARRPLTRYVDDGVHHPTISADGSTIVFRHLFDLYRLHPGRGEEPQLIEIVATGDDAEDPLLHRTLSKADSVAFTDDAREIAFTAGGDVWVMDTELREPRQVTSTPEEEREPVFSPDFETLYFVSDAGGQPDVWKAKRADAERHWWQSEEFRLEKLTDDAAPEYYPSIVPGGERIAFVKGLGELWTMNPDGSEPIRLVSSWDHPWYEFAPDGKWVAYAVDDENFNSDVWIRSTDGEGEPFNVSRHPADDYSPAWSPDGRILAFTGARTRQERDICYVWLRKADEEERKRDRTLEKARAKMKGRKGASSGAKKEPDAIVGTWRGRVEGESPLPPEGVEVSLEVRRDDEGAPVATLTVPEFFAGQVDTFRHDPGSGKVRLTATTALGPLEVEAKVEADRLQGVWKIEGAGQGPFTLRRETERKEKPSKDPDVVIDFDGLEDRIHRVAIPNTSERGLLWSPDAKRLAFRATIDGTEAIYTIAFPDDLKPKRLTTTLGTYERWLKEGKQIAWLVSGVPATMSGSGKGKTFPFEVRQVVDRAARHRAAFDQAWRVMRDTFYDERLNNLDWDAVRAKYRPVAAATTAPEELETVVRMMLGELNASHLAFGAKKESWSRPGWRPVTGHLGARFDAAYEGQGLRVRDVVRGTPAHAVAHRLEPMDVVLEIDGVTATHTNVHRLLTGPRGRDVELRVLRAGGETETLRIRPTSYDDVRRKLYDEWLRHNRELVDRHSEGRFGYVHVRSMNWSSFDAFTAALYKAGHGKDALLIDVRDNGGGFTADHLLTALTLPRHARTVSRGGRPGYPQDRHVYAGWWRPVAVLCNQYSFSNAEIFAHAVKTLGRGPVVGVPTAGGVISTGRTTIMDVGSLRTPTRGWFVLPTGEDMERAGCVPDHVVWPEPPDEALGEDRQVEKAVEVLRDVVEQARRRAPPPPRFASERPGPSDG